MFFMTWREDIRSVKHSDPAARNALEIVLNYPGFHAVRWHRRAHWLYTHHMKGPVSYTHLRAHETRC